MKCAACGKLGPADKCSPEAQSWDWFTGYLANTVHFCPKHVNSKLAKELWRKSQAEVISER
jgi:hypothetical protein